MYRAQELNLRPSDDTIFGKIILYIPVVFFYKQIILYIVFFYIKNIQLTQCKIIFTLKLKIFS